MNHITEEVIEECFYNGKITNGNGKWRVVTEHGRVFEFDDSGIDLTQCLTPLAPGETEDNREEAMFGACSFAQEIWGCVDVRKMGFVARGRMAAYARAYGFTVDENTFREFGIADAKSIFGETAMVRNNWFPCGWRITVPDVGFVVLGGDLQVRKISGDLYSRTLRFIQKMGQQVVVRGRASFCLTWMTHGELLGVRVIPEVPRTWLGYWAFSHIAAIAALVVGFAFADLVPAASVWVSIAVGWIAGALVMWAWLGGERQRGEALRNKFPSSGTERRANLHELRERGML